MLDSHAIPVTLHVEVETGRDSFNRPIVEETLVKVDGCLVVQNTNDAMVDSTMLDGIKETYTIAVPKGDTHEWSNRKVEFDLAGEHIIAKVFGSSLKGIETLMPLKWHKQVRCERYG